uniref:Cell division protein n=1 Tax=Stephanosphaera pluvialis TaxID=51712 RepID=A0A0S2IDQ6_9CHLO|nr:cell division protein [Stephanosphaera pluvialis]
MGSEAARPSSPCPLVFANGKNFSKGSMTAPSMGSQRDPALLRRSADRNYLPPPGDRNFGGASAKGRWAAKLPGRRAPGLFTPPAVWFLPTAKTLTGGVRGGGHRAPASRSANSTASKRAADASARQRAGGLTRVARDRFTERLSAPQGHSHNTKKTPPLLQSFNKLPWQYHRGANPSLYISLYAPWNKQDRVDSNPDSDLGSGSAPDTKSKKASQLFKKQLVYFMSGKLGEMLLFSSSFPLDGRTQILHNLAPPPSGQGGQGARWPPPAIAGEGPEEFPLQGLLKDGVRVAVSAYTHGYTPKKPSRGRPSSPFLNSSVLSSPACYGKTSANSKRVRLKSCRPGTIDLCREPTFAYEIYPISEGKRVQGKNSSRSITRSSLQGSFSFLNTWKTLSSLVLSFVHKRFLYYSSLIVPKFLKFNNKNSLLEPPSEFEGGSGAPSSSILLPARRYENLKRNFHYFNKIRSLSFQFGKKTNSAGISIGIIDKIFTHQQQRFIKKLYGLPTVAFSPDCLRPAEGSCFEFGAPSMASLPPLDGVATRPHQGGGGSLAAPSMARGSMTSKQADVGQRTEHIRPGSFENNYNSFDDLMLDSLSSDMISNTNLFMKNKILMRHKNYLTNQWWTGQLPEHNASTTYLSDIDWRFTFVESIGDLLLDFPDADQHYNPRNRRWFLTKGSYHNWFDFEKNIYSEIYYSFVFNAFIEAFTTFEHNREVLDFYAFFSLKNGLHRNLSELRVLKLYKRF